MNFKVCCAFAVKSRFSFTGSSPCSRISALPLCSPYSDSGRNRSITANSPSARWPSKMSLLPRAKSKSDILLGQRADGEFAVIERFRPESLYGEHNGSAEILLQGDDPVKLNRDFTANAQHTLKFMASNLTAKAQKIVWEQFPDHRPGHIVAAITERCHQAIANEETISQNRSEERR